MIAIPEFIRRLDRLDIRLWEESGRLRYNAPKGTLTAELKGEISGRREEILEFLRLAKQVSNDGLPPIRPAPRDRPVPLSFPQQRLWFLQRFDEGNAAYNMPCAMHVRGNLHVTVLEQCLNEIIRRHEILRTVYPAAEGRAFQRICDPGSPGMPLSDLEGSARAPGDRLVQRIIEEESRRSFDLAGETPIRFRLLRLSERNHILLLVTHHIAFDGWSEGILTRELSILYRDRTKGGRGSSEKPLIRQLEIQYADYACWQRECADHPRIREQRKFWRSFLSKAPPALDLFPDRPRPEVRSYSGGRSTFHIGSIPARGVRELAGRMNATPFMVLLAAYAALLARRSGSDDLVIGSPVANRNRAETESLIGFFVNTLPLRIDLSQAEDFAGALRKVRDAALGAYANQDVPLELIIEDLDVRRNLSRSPLFQVLFAFQNIPPEPISIPDLEISPLPVHTATSKFDLTLTMEESEGGGYVGEWEYNADMFDEDTILQMSAHYGILLASCIRSPDRSFRSVPLVSAREGTPPPAAGDAVGDAETKSRCLDVLFAESAARHSGSPALSCGEQVLTYGELDAATSCLAEGIRKRIGSGYEGPIALLTGRSPKMIIGILGILRTGGAYVPLNPDDPNERLKRVATDAGVPLVVIEGETVPQAQRLGLPLLIIGSGEVPPMQTCETDARDSKSLAYVMYTSGSTGRPKGVQVEHRSVANLVRGIRERVYSRYGERLNVALVASYVFDASVQQIFACLLLGHCLHIVPDADRRDGVRLIRFLAEHGIDVCDGTPAHLRLLAGGAADAGEGLPVRHFLIGGESLSAKTVSAFFRAFPDASPMITNLYGPTECCVDATSYDIDPDELGRLDRIPIGTPLPGQHAYIMGEDGVLEPDGLPGEIVIGGLGVARGYLGRDDLTAERFLDDPLVPGERIYKTGDRGRRCRDGSIEFLGRLDDQIKLRGYRIEPGEIACVLEEHPGVEGAAAVLREEGSERRRLLAYAVSKEAASPSEEDLMRHLRDRLPEYMVPAACVVLDEWPLTVSGKIDRRALPDPSSRRDASVYAAPRNPVEERLAEIWQTVLGVERIGIDDNFFELGGDSILSIQVVARANAAGIPLTPQCVFKHQTVAELARASGGARRIDADQEPVEGQAPLAPIQKWFFEQEPPNPHHFNQTVVLNAFPGTDPGPLAEAFRRVERHHDSLRLRFFFRNGEWEQRYAPPCETLPFSFLDLSGEEREDAHRVAARRCEAEQSSLHLTKGPIWRAVHFRMPSGESDLVLFTVHHLAVDGVSWGILVEDLARLYAGLLRDGNAALPLKTTSFKAWAVRLADSAEAGQNAAELPFWSETVARCGDEPRGSPPTGIERYPEASSETLASVLMGRDVQSLLAGAARNHGCGIDEILLASLLVAWRAVMGGDFLVVDLEGHGRESPFDDVDVTRTVGWFTTMYPVRFPMPGGGGWEAALRVVRERFGEIPGKGIGYGILRYLHPEGARILKRRENARPQICFNYLGRVGEQFSRGPFSGLSKVDPGPLRDPAGFRSHALEMNAYTDAAGAVHMDWTFSGTVHARSDVKRLAGEFETALREAAGVVKEEESTPPGTKDFPLAGLDGEKLENLARLIDRADGVEGPRG